MPDIYPIPLGARLARRSHKQFLVSIPMRLVQRWAIGASTQLYWSLVDDTTVMIRKLDPPMPGRPFPLDDPRRRHPNVPNAED